MLHVNKLGLAQSVVSMCAHVCAHASGLYVFESAVFLSVIPPTSQAAQS